VIDDAPEGWVRLKLDEVVEPGGVFDGPFGSSLKTSDYTASGIRVIRLENLANLGFIADKQTYISAGKYETLRKHTVVAGDILVGSFVDGAVRVCVLPDLPTPAVAKADCFTVRTRTDVVDRRFAALQIGTFETRDKFVGDIHGATRPRITTRQLRALELAVAPLPEQQRIVTKVEGLLEQVARAKARLDRVQLIMKRFRQAVLAAACSGELTRAWREDRGDAVTQAAECAIGGVLEVPDSWRVYRFGDILAELRNGVSPRPALTPPGVPVLRISAVRTAAVDLSDVRYLTNGEKFSESFLQENDLLFTRYNGSIELLGVCGLVRGLAGRKLLYPDKLMRARTNPAFASPEYVEVFIGSPGARERLTSKAKSSAGQQGISGKNLKDQLVALPPLSEQDEIARRVHQLLTLADTIDRRVLKTAARAERMPQAILSKAFAGELVPTEAELARAEGRAYETAGDLLQRLPTPPALPPQRAKKSPRRRARVAGTA
jgi:type I restriction enzyme S subunit